MWGEGIGLLKSICKVGNKSEKFCFNLGLGLPLGKIGLIGCMVSGKRVLSCSVISELGVIN